MVRALRSDGGVPPTQTEDVCTIERWLEQGDGLVWVDVHDPEPAEASSEALHLLNRVFAFHPLAVEDALTETHVPKVDDWGAYLYLVLHAVHLTDDGVETRELDVFLGSNYLVTYRTQEIHALTHQWRVIQRDARHIRRGVDHLLYALCDAIAADYLPVMDAIQEAVDRLQDEVFEQADGQVLKRLFKLKRAVLDLRRILAPQREVLNKLARGDFPMIDPRDQIYFRDVYDHYVRLADLNESLRDMVSGTLDTYLSVTANRTNDIVKTLTIVSLMFLPLTFVTGFFGMNFFGSSVELVFDLPKWLFFVAGMVAMAVLPLVLLVYIRRRGWW